MSFQVHQNTILWESDIKKGTEPRTKEAVQVTEMSLKNKKGITIIFRYHELPG